jgi:hypothetical protein
VLQFCFRTAGVPIAVTTITAVLLGPLGPVDVRPPVLCLPAVR